MEKQHIIAGEVLQHMRDYVDYPQQTRDDMHTLGYLDTPQWIDAISQMPNAKDPAYIAELKALAKKVDARYSTSFEMDIEEHITGIDRSDVREIVNSHYPDNEKLSYNELLEIIKRYPAEKDLRKIVGSIMNNR